jgi:hypothetical protein
MMNSSYDDDDEFGPNPFRTGSGSHDENDLLGTPNPSPPPPPDPFAPQNHLTMQHQAAMQQQRQTPDPNSGMTGNFQLPPPAPQAVARQASPQYLTGTMDQKAAVSASGQNNYGGTSERDVPSTPFSIFSWRGCLSCFRLDTYGRYFDVDTADVAARVRGSLTQFFLPDQFRTAVVGDDPSAEPPAAVPPDADAAALPGDYDRALKGPDLYGPVWVGITLIFILGVTSNLSAYMHHRQKAKRSSEGEEVEEFEADIHHLLRAGSVVIFFALGVPTAFWFATQCLGMPSVQWAMWMTIYGYAQVPVLVGSLVAWILPVDLWHWIALGCAVGASGLLVVRNLSTPLLSQDSASHAKAAPIILGILGAQFVYLCVLKIAFYGGL